jgi:hypothetical protein
MRILKCLLGLALILPALSGCKKHASLNDQPINIQFLNQPLDVVQQAVLGKWNLVRAYGGICSTCEHTVQYHPYMFISDTRISLGTDLGVESDTPLTWERQSVGTSFTYVLSFGFNRKVLEGITNDTLKIHDDNPDATYYEYRR